MYHDEGAMLAFELGVCVRLLPHPFSKHGDRARMKRIKRDTHAPRDPTTNLGSLAHEVCASQGLLDRLTQLLYSPLGPRGGCSLFESSGSFFESVWTTPVEA